MIEPPQSAGSHDAFACEYSAAQYIASVALPCDKLMTVRQGRAKHDLQGLPHTVLRRAR